MREQRAFIIFVALLLLCIFIQYYDFIDSAHSLFLAFFWDPTPRIGLYPWLVESTRQLRDGHFPLWCNLKGAGMPLWANYQTAPLNPFNIIFEIFPSLKLLDYLLMLKLFLLGVFSYWLGRELRLCFLARTLAAVSICFCGFIRLNINHINLNVDLWVPVGLVLVEKIYKTQANFAKLIGLSLLSALIFLGGNPQAGFYALVFISGYALIRGGWGSKKKILVIMVSLCFGCALSSVQLFNFIEYLGYSWNYHTGRIFSLDYLSAQRLFSLFFPWLFKPMEFLPEWFKLPGYIGLIPLFLLLFSLSRINRIPRSALFFWIYLIVVWSMIYKLFPFSYLNYLPVLDKIRTPKHAYFGVCLCIAMLSGYGMDYFFKKLVSLRNYILAVSLINFIAVLSLVLAFILSRHIGMINWMPVIIPLILLMSAELLVAYGIFSGKTELAGLVIIGLVCVNVIYLGAGLRPELTDTKFYQYDNNIVPPIYQPIIEDKTLCRMVATGKTLSPDLNVLFRANDFREFDGIYPRAYAEKMADIYGIRIEDLKERYISQGWWFGIEDEHLAHKWLNVFGVKYIISEHRLNSPDLILIGRSQDHYLYMNQDAIPRVWLKLYLSGLDFKNARIYEYKPDMVMVVAHSSENSDLVLADQYAPGWRAFILPAGTEVKIFKEDGIFRKVKLSRGVWEIKFLYQPWGFRIGLFFSIGFLLGMFLLSFAHLTKKYIIKSK